MKLLFLSKRRPQGKDLLSRPYGRFFHIPRLLAKRGHEVTLLLLDYRKDPALEIDRNGIHWLSRSLWGRGHDSYWATANFLAKKEHPDWIIGCSDTYFGIMAEYLAESFDAASLIDAYDNYESYLPWCRPLHHLWRHAIAKADVVTAAGPQLADLLHQQRPDKPVHVVPMAADPNIFIPLDRNACRLELNIPIDKKAIGYCGSIYHNRGMEILFEAHQILKKHGNNIDLLLTGRKSKSITIPASAQWLGYLPDEKMSVFLNSLDIAVILNRTSSFGNFSYPVKLYEAMRCHIPVIATNTPPANWILEGDKRFLTQPDDPYDLADKIRQALKLGRTEYGEQSSWEQSCSAFEKVLLKQQVVNN